MVCRFGPHGVLCEVQLSFRSVHTLKSFAHPAYEVARIGLGPEVKRADELVKGLFTVPLDAGGIFLAYGYSSRSPEDIQLKVRV